MRPNKKAGLLTLTLAFGLMFAAKAEIKIGDSLPDLTAFKIEGKLPDSLKDKVVLVDFWASWCGPCGESFATMEELHKKYADQGLVIIAVNVDEKKNDMEDFLKEHHVTFIIVRDAKQKLVDKAGIATMPSSFLVDKNGKVVFAHSGFHGAQSKKEYVHEIESLLKPNQK